jgi:hypothetical protein
MVMKEKRPRVEERKGKKGKGREGKGREGRRVIRPKEACLTLTRFFFFILDGRRNDNK